MRLAVPGQIVHVVDDANRPAKTALEEGLRMLLPERLPPNDGCIAYGQAAVAAARLDGAGASGWPG